VGKEGEIGSVAEGSDVLDQVKALLDGEEGQGGGHRLHVLEQVAVRDLSPVVSPQPLDRVEPEAVCR